MKFIELKLKGAYLIELEEFKDNRGTFCRQFCKKEFKEGAGIDFDIKQCNLSGNYKKNTLRGLHYQKAPYLEPKIVSCFKGKVIDVIVDLRPESDTYLQYESFELEAGDNKLLYIPPNFAHGFLTEEDDTIMYYQLGEFFYSEYYDGIRYNDPKIGIDWGSDLKDVIINERDDNYKLI